MKALAINKRAKFDYDINDTIDAGLILSGPEVKAAKEGNVSLAGSYVKVSVKGASLIGAHIGHYKYAKQENYEPTQTRKLLLKQSELNALVGKEKGSIIVPMEMYVANRGLIKMKIGIGFGRKKADKREYIKQRDDKRETRGVTDR
jgi:SsrA-binding protein